MTQPIASDVWSLLVETLGDRIRAAGLDPAELADDTDLLDTGVLDSLGVLEMIALVEDRFELETDWEDFDPEDILVMGPFCRYVEQQVALRR